MKILAVETSGKTCSIALSENEKIVASFYYDCGHIHSEILIPAVERLLKDTGNSFENIDKFAVSVGPGSFTGIRVGTTAVKTFAQILNKPIAAIDTLSILEKSFVEIKGIETIAAIDALKNEVYVKNDKEIIIKNIDLFIKDLKKYKNKILVMGNAAIIYKEKFSKGLGKYSVSLPYNMHIPQSQTLAAIAYNNEKSVSYKEVQPLYIRRTRTEETKKK
ncbi:MAG: tRNA (adenosine(37)-N6)-threonylcarbamoyltransferase complex dimerization subunit type 1 TsaB [Endomicrobium sp.]|nr:tRNA (adenosine(37)-N6)-threonylcarbamoyltransferase complex dimerization subunit type 1 TsaB [Endomicrobium sp.]